MKIGQHGQVTIPKSIRDRHGLHKDVDVEFVDDDGGIRIIKRAEGAKRVAKIRGTAKLRQGESVDDYIEGIRGR